jgi:uncharacterized protein
MGLDRVVVIPGNGCYDIMNSNWYGWLHEVLRERHDIQEVICENMPDPDRARATIWLPFMKDVLKIDKSTIAIGHSSGAVALMRFAELHQVGAIILVSACWSDLGIKSERLSGYYPHSDGSNPWRFDLMRTNCLIWHQFHSDDDPFISVDEAERVKEGLELRSSVDYHFLENRSHFFDYPFPELVSVVETVLSSESSELEVPNNR